MNLDNFTLFFGFLNFSSLAILSFIHICNPLNVNRIANRWFGTFLLLWAFFYSEEIVWFIYKTQPNFLWLYIVRFFQYLTPLMFYLSIIFYTDPSYNIKKNIWSHCILPFLYFILLFFYYWGGMLSDKINYLLIFILLGQSLFYVVASYIRIRKHKKNILKFASNVKVVDLFWLERVIYALLFILIVIIFYNLFISFKSLNLFMNVLLQIVIFDIAYHSLRQKEIFPMDNEMKEEIVLISNESENDEFRKKIISDEELVILKTQLNEFMHNREPYLDPDLSLIKLSELFGTTPHRLSYILNSGFNKNFFNFINSYRVEKAKLLLNNSDMNQYSILGIAFESGFNSKSTFHTIFKKETGFTPTDFKKRSSTL